MFSSAPLPLAGIKWAALRRTRPTGPFGCSATLSIQRRSGRSLASVTLALDIEHDQVPSFAAHRNALAYSRLRGTGCRSHGRPPAISRPRRDQKERFPPAPNGKAAYLFAEKMQPA